MADKKIIAVVGATGSQGGGLVQAILNDPNGGFAVRAITRDVNTDKAKALAAVASRGAGKNRRANGSNGDRQAQKRRDS